MKKTIKVLLALVGMTGCVTYSNAQNAIMTIYDGVNPLITVYDNGPGDQSGAYGGILIQTNVGVWSLTIASAVTKPLFGSPTSPVMDINVQALSSGAGSLWYTFSDNNFLAGNGVLNSTLSGGLLFGSATASFGVFADPANIVGATTIPITQIGPVTLPISGTLTDSQVYSLPIPNSFTEVVNLNASQSSYFSIDASFNVSAVPEPSTLVLAGMGGVAILSLIRRRNA